MLTDPASNLFQALDDRTGPFPYPDSGVATRNKVCEKNDYHQCDPLPAHAKVSSKKSARTFWDRLDAGALESGVVTPMPKHRTSSGARHNLWFGESGRQRGSEDGSGTGFRAGAAAGRGGGAEIF